MQSSVYDQSTFLVFKAAYLYYFQDKPQNEIADILNISISTVSRLIRKAKQDGIVEFVIRNPYMDCLETEDQIKNKFNLRDVIVVPPIKEFGNHLENKANARKLVALEGARYVQRIITENDVLGLSWGKTMYDLIHYLNPCQKVNASFVTMHGSISGCHPDLDVLALGSRISMAFGGQNYSLLAEGLMSNEKIVASVKNEKYVNKIFEIFKHISISLTSVGAFFPNVDSLLYKQGGYLLDSEIRELKQRGAVGDISLRFIDSQGNECNTSFRNRTIGIELDLLKKIRTKIMVASGDSKVHALKGVLAGGLTDILIIDYALGKAVLN
ncbi:MAG: DeoR family transcriptional regulator, DeoR [Firmicutes bacterium]|nr:DeoR family transcriptional regulator, DeoR [Bacillota bacterium]